MDYDTHIDKAQEKRRKISVTLVWFLLACASYGTYILSNNIQNGADSSAALFLGFNSASTHEIVLSSETATPSLLHVKQGDTVRFVTSNESPHNIALRSSHRNDARVESGEFHGRDTYELQFHEVGQFELYDRLNLDLTITVVVEP